MGFGGSCSSGVVWRCRNKGRLGNFEGRAKGERSKVVLVATGATLIVLEIKGVDRDTVVTATNMGLAVWTQLLEMIGEVDVNCINEHQTY